ncbi:MAG TPA: formylmethanofuran--tetrahydromethanopterin N-formyltransferase [Gammaproteobacteria bacterium]|nr:formylmethanofuran--tetrahydromethanopterin N-formyltransferase [Gammaproteobacteria bacterium]
MIVNGTTIDNTFAEAFGMKATRVVITALNHRWARHAAQAMTGFATSVIGCGVEAGIENELPAGETPDGRPGVSVLMFGMSGKALGKQLEKRVSQCVLTSPTSAVFAGMCGEKCINLGRNVRFFGDGYQISKLIDGHRCWRIPVMDGEFIAEESTAYCSAVGGGNFLVLAESTQQALIACEAAIDAMQDIPNVIMPFPGGVVRSGSKVGSIYKALPASTNQAFCPTLKGMTRSHVPDDVESVLEIVINGLTDDDIRRAIRTGVDAVCALGAGQGIKRVSAGNYGGKLGQFHFHLREIMA